MQKWALFLLVLMVAAEALALTVEGKEFEPTTKAQLLEFSYAPGTGVVFKGS
jgi:hypothetical protein